MSCNQYYITHHLRERFLQRTDKKFKHMQQCRDPYCRMCDQLGRQIKNLVFSNRREIDEKILQRLNSSKENRSYINNSGFMSWYHEKYGFEKRFQFLVHEDLLFVVVIDEGQKVVVTCVVAKTHLAGKNAIRPKYKKVS